MRSTKFTFGGRCFLTVFCMFAMLALWRSECRADFTLVEDFQDDSNPSLPGFGSSVFVHNFVGSNYLLKDPTPVIPPSPAHALFMGAATTDSVTFTLLAGQSVDSASVWMTGTGGGAAGVTFFGTNKSLDFSTTVQDSFQQFSVTPADNLGEITGILLGAPLPPLGPGQEAYYDDITIHVVPEPSALGFLPLALLAVQRYRRRLYSFSQRCEKMVRD